MNSEIFKRIMSSIILLPIVFFLIIKGSFYFYFLLTITFVISIYEWHIMSKNKSYYLFGFIFLIISFYSFYQLRVSFENDYLMLIIVTLICILTDIGGFLFGKTFKGPKLTKYSPNKTYAGVLGGYIFAFTIIPYLFFYKFSYSDNILSIFIFVFLLSTVSQIGDIIISYFKRISNIKDTGKIIPGHGGLLDRIDGMIFTFPFSYLFLLTNFNI